MSNRYARIMAAGGAAVLVAVLGVTAALAATATTWTIQPGGAVQAASGKVALTDTTNRGVSSCDSSAALGKFKSGSGRSGLHAASLSAVSFTHCTGPGGPQFTLLPSALPWHVDFSSYNAANRVARGRISHLHIALAGTGGCSAVIDGTGASADDGQVVFRYADSTGRLTVLATGSNLHFYHVSGCLDLFKSGDSATFSIIYTVTPKQAITSP